MTVEIKKIAQLTGHNAALYALDIDANGIYTGGGDGWVVKWGFDDLNLGKVVSSVERQIFSLKKLKNQSKILIGDMDGGVRLVDFDQPERSRHVAHHGGKGTFGFLELSENAILSIGGDGILTRWQLDPFRSVESLQLSARSLRAMAYAPTREILAVGSSDGHLFLLNRQLEILHTERNAHQNSVFALNFSSDETKLFSAGRDACLKSWSVDLDTGGGHILPQKSVNAHWYTVNAVAVHPTMPILATASRDKTIKIWDLSTLTLLKVVDTIRHGCHIRSVNRLIWQPDSDTLVSVSDDRTAIVWDVKINI